MRKVISFSEHKSRLAKAIHKQKKQLAVEVNKRQYLYIPRTPWFRYLYELLLAVEKKLRNKK